MLWHVETCCGTRRKIMQIIALIFSPIAFFWRPQKLKISLHDSLRECNFLMVAGFRILNWLVDIQEVQLTVSCYLYLYNCWWTSFSWWDVSSFLFSVLDQLRASLCIVKRLCCQEVLLNVASMYYSLILCLFLLSCVRLSYLVSVFMAFLIVIFYSQFWFFLQ